MDTLSEGQEGFYKSTYLGVFPRGLVTRSFEAGPDTSWPLPPRSEGG